MFIIIVIIFYSFFKNKFAIFTPENSPKGD